MFTLTLSDNTTRVMAYIETGLKEQRYIGAYGGPS